MSLKYVLLGMLKNPATGYDLKMQFEQGAKFFWSAEFGQIYSTLKQLVECGWLKSKSAPADKGPPRKLYLRTRSGMAALKEWLSQGPVFGTEKYPYVAQMIFLGQLGDVDESLSFLSQLKEEISGARATLLGSEKWHKEQVKDSPDDLELTHELLAVQLGVQTLDAKIHWCDLASQRLKRLGKK